MRQPTDYELAWIVVMGTLFVAITIGFAVLEHFLK